MISPLFVYLIFAVLFWIILYLTVNLNKNFKSISINLEQIGASLSMTDARMSAIEGLLSLILENQDIVSNRSDDKKKTLKDLMYN